MSAELVGPVVKLPRNSVSPASVKYLISSVDWLKTFLYISEPL